MSMQRIISRVNRRRYQKAQETLDEEKTLASPGFGKTYLKSLQVGEWFALTAGSDVVIVGVVVGIQKNGFPKAVTLTKYAGERVKGKAKLQSLAHASDRPVRFDPDRPKQIMDLVDPADFPKIKAKVMDKAGPMLKESSDLDEAKDDVQIKITNVEGYDRGVKFPLTLSVADAEKTWTKWSHRAPPKGKGYDKSHFELLYKGKVISRARMDLNQMEPVELQKWVDKKLASVKESIELDEAPAPPKDVEKAAAYRLVQVINGLLDGFRGAAKSHPLVKAITSSGKAIYSAIQRYEAKKESTEEILDEPLDGDTELEEATLRGGKTKATNECKRELKAMEKSIGKLYTKIRKLEHPQHKKIADEMTAAWDSIHASYEILNTPPKLGESRQTEEDAVRGVAKLIRETNSFYPLLRTSEGKKVARALDKTEGSIEDWFKKEDIDFKW